MQELRSETQLTFLSIYVNSHTLNRENINEWKYSVSDNFILISINTRKAKEAQLYLDTL